MQIVDAAVPSVCRNFTVVEVGGRHGMSNHNNFSPLNPNYPHDVPDHPDPDPEV